METCMYTVHVHEADHTHTRVHVEVRARTASSADQAPLGRQHMVRT